MATAKKAPVKNREEGRPEEGVREEVLREGAC